MSSIQFLVEWALRSSLLVAGGGLLLKVLRVKDPAVRLAAWTAVLLGSLAIPLVREALPRLPVTVAHLAHTAVSAVPAPNGSFDVPPTPVPGSAAVRRFDWAGAGVAVYALGALVLLLRVGIGLFAGWRLLRASGPTGRAIDGIEIRESALVPAPLTLGMVRPAIVLPVGWREWEARKIEAVLAHERSHVRRFDPAVQVLSAIHRALLWHSPLSWFLHQRIVREAEEASDDAAIGAACDRPSYAEILTEFMRGPVGVPMGRYGNPEQRIRRILEGTVLSRGVTRWSVAAIVAVGCPSAYLVAAAQPQRAQAAAQVQGLAGPAPREQKGADSSTPAAQGGSYIAGLGSVAPSVTVTVRPRIDGQLLSVDFKEGETVQAGQLLATLDPRPYEGPVRAAEAQLSGDETVLRNARMDLDRVRNQASANLVAPQQVNDAMASVAKYEAQLEADQAKLDQAKLLLSYTRIVSPITGVAGLRQIDPGNLVHAEDSRGIVVITQVRPIAVIFTMLADRTGEVAARLRSGASITVEAWNRDASRKLGTGRLIAVDNQIDTETGMGKLKAVFDNKDGALVNGAFVNVRMFLDQ